MYTLIQTIRVITTSYELSDFTLQLKFFVWIWCKISSYTPFKRPKSDFMTNTKLNAKHQNNLIFWVSTFGSWSMQIPLETVQKNEYRECISTQIRESCISNKRLTGKLMVGCFLYREYIPFYLVSIKWYWCFGALCLVFFLRRYSGYTCDCLESDLLLFYMVFPEDHRGFS